MSKPKSSSKGYLGIDVGTKRIGVARAGAVARLAEPLVTIPVNGKEVQRIVELAIHEDADTVVVGKPRGLNGQTTPQTVYTEQFAELLKLKGLKVVMMDEALTSEAAASFLKSKHRPGWSQEDVDNISAMIILDDYLSQ